MENCKMIKTYLLSFSKKDCAADKWDYGLLKEVFDKYEIEQVKVDYLPKEERAFVVIPGPQNIGHEEYINQEIQNISRLVLFVNGLGGEGRIRCLPETLGNAGPYSNMYPLKATVDYQI